METPSRHSFSLNGSTRVFPIPSPIKGDNYCRLEVDGVIVNDRTKYDIVNNSIVFLNVADVPSGSQLDVLVVQSEEAIGQLAITTNIDIVASNIADINTVATDIANVTTVHTNIVKVNTVADNIANVNLTAGSIGSVNIVAGNTTNVNKVAAIDTNVTTVATNDANVTKVANIDTNVTKVANIDANVTKVANIDTNVTTVADNDANVTIVAGVSPKVTTVADNVVKVTAVADNATNINAVFANASNITAVAGNESNINAVFGNATNINSAVANAPNINAVVANAPNINAVAGNETNINAVFNNATNINTVADNIGDVNTVVTNLAAIIDAPNQATDAAASAVSAAQSAASAATILDNFDDRYLGAKASDPALDNDGEALIVGALYFNTTDGVMKIYTATGWLAASSASVGTLATYEFVATSGQTVFSGADANGITLSYTAPSLLVTLNGVRLRPGDDYTATDGVTVTLVAGATTGDELVIDAFGNFLVADVVSRASGGTFQAAVNVLGNMDATSFTVGGAPLEAGAKDGIFWENEQTVTQDYTITAGRNAGTFGAVTINSGVTVTVPTGSRWVIV